MIETLETVPRFAGSIPEPYASLVEDEGILLLAEGVSASLFMPYFRAPRKFFWRSRQWYNATLALSNKRLLAISRRPTNYVYPAINVPFSDSRFQQMRFDLEKDDTLVVSHKAALFCDEWSGTLEHRFRTADAPRIVALLRQHAVQMPDGVPVK